MNICMQGMIQISYSWVSICFLNFCTQELILLSPPPDTVIIYFCPCIPHREDAGRGFKSRIRPPHPQRVVKGD